MLTIVIHYSCDRQPQLENTIACLDEMDGTQHAQKILLVDGKTNVFPADWTIVEVERDDPHFYNCSKIWNLGFRIAKNEVVLTMESDRILPKKWLSNAMTFLDSDRTFVATKKLISLDSFYPLNIVKDIRDYPYHHWKKFINDYRVFDPDQGIGRKNPMSGCVLTTKTAFEFIGGFDEGYLQAGYHDLDAFRAAVTKGAKIVHPDKGIEFHQHHEYTGGIKRFQIVNLWNAVRYHDKWELELHPNILKLARFVEIPIQDIRNKSLTEILIV